MSDLGEGQLRTLLDATGLAVAACDADGWLTVLSPALEEMFGSFERVHASEFVARFGLRDATGEATLRERDVPLVRAMRREVVRDAVITAVDHDGGVLYLRNNAAPVLGNEGSVVGAVVLVQDITAEQAARLEREALRSRLIETVNHELRTPLTKLLGHVELLHEDASGLSPAHQNSVLVLYKAVQELCSTVQTVSELNDLESHTRLSKTYGDLVGLISDVVDEARRFPPCQGQTLVVDTPQSVLITLDPMKVHRALLELVHNAAIFGPVGGQIRLRVLAEPDSVTIEVTDRGAGIAQDEQDRLVKPFERGTHPRQPVNSKGLGLAIAHEVALAHQGQLLFSDDPVEGFTVTLRLPR